ncbi:MAG: nidogen-like domain-containing protein [Dehalococcoidia bacterium]
MKRVLYSIVALFALFLSFSLLGDGARAQDDIAGAGNKAILDLPGCTTSSIPANDDGSSPQVATGFPLNFFGTSYSSLYVNNNGNVTFGSTLATYTPFPLQEQATDSVIIAPYFGDVDTRAAGSGLTTYGTTTFIGRPAFCVNWVNVGYYAVHLDKQNSFQLLLVDRSDVGVGDFDIIFNYNKVQWETGDVSGGTGGLGGDSARVGYTNGVDTSLELPGSAVNGAFLDSAATGLIHNSFNSLQHGRYIFSVRNGAAPVGGTISGLIHRNDLGGDSAVPGSFVQACFAFDPAPPCQVTTSDANGHYQFVGLPGGGNYFVTAFPPSGETALGPRTIGALFMPVSGADLVNQDIKLIPSVPPPPGVTIETPYHAGDGTPAISRARGATFRQTGACAGGSASWSITQNGNLITSGSMTETAPGKYKGTIPPILTGNVNGRATMNITINCPGVGDKDDDFDIYIDPSGHVLNSVNGMPVVGATVTLYRSDSAVGPFAVVPDESAVMSPSNRNNPDLTDAEGFYRWDVIAGYYQVRAEKTGCHAPGNAGQAFVETIVLQVPPPQLDVDLMLDCGSGPQPTSTPPGPTPGPTMSGPTPTPSIEYGNVNCVGGVNSIDAALVLQFGASLITSLACQAAANVNGDSAINSIDAAFILQFVSGLLGHLPV